MARGGPRGLSSAFRREFQRAGARWNLRREVLALVIATIAVIGCPGEEEPVTAQPDGGSDSVTPPEDAPPATDATDDDGVVETDGTDVPPPVTPTDPLVRIAARSQAGFPRAAGAVAGHGGRILACDGNLVVALAAADLKQQWSATLPGRCAAVALDGTVAIASDEQGVWHTFEQTTGASTATTPGPTAQRLALGDQRVFGALGVGGLAVGPADLSTPPTTHPVTADARDVVPVSGERLAVADGVAGVQWLDIAGPEPTLLSTWATSESQLASGLAALGGDRLVVAVIGHGLVVLGTSGDTLTEIGSLTLNPRGLPLDIAAGPDGQTALLADWDRVRLIGVSPGSAPTVLARELFAFGATDGQRAFGTVRTDAGFAVLGTDHLTALVAAPEAEAAEIWLHPKRPFLATEGTGLGSAAVVLSNTGAKALEITSVTPQTDRITVLSPAGGAATVETGGIEVLEFTVQGDDPLETAIVLGTNDPDHGELVLPVTINPTLLGIGDPAPDFLVPTAGGRLAKMSDYSGKAVYLRFFNAQCESCIEELPIIESDFWQVYGNQGFQATSVHLGDDIATGLSFLRKTKITFPMLLDLDLEVLRLYTRVGESQYLFPLVYLTGPTGSVAHIYTDEETPHAELATAVEALLP